MGNLMVPQNVLRWLPIAQKWAVENAPLLPNEILAIIQNESSGEPTACNPSDPSYGLMGVTMPIARRYSKRAQTPTDLYDPDINVEAGSGFLAYLKARYDISNPLTDPNSAWPAMYNAGEPAILRGFKDPNYIAAFVSHLVELNNLEVK
jgi:soluble lytic murein transglycosylase-like protein